MKKGIINPYEINTVSIQEIPEINTIKISREAFYKMNLYSSIVSEISGYPIECVGTLLNYKNKNDNIARDIHLEGRQEVTGSNGWRGNRLDDSKEIEDRGMYVIGLWHSHGSNGVFHSGFDNSVLKEMFPWIKNKMIVGEKPKDIECIADGETIRIFEEGKNRELRIKGKIEDLKFVEWDKEYFIMNSIVINNNSYSGGFLNPKLRHDYDGEVWVGYNKPVGREYKRFEHAKLEIIEENNNIELDEEKLVQEVGEKVRLRGVCFNGINKPYLKDLPNYQKVLEKYRNTKNQNKPIEQIVNSEKKQEETNPQIKVQEQKDGNERKSENTNLQTIVQEQKKPVEQETEQSQEPHRTKTYMERLEDFYDYLNMYSDSTYKLLAELCRVNSGKLYWFWNERYKKSKEIINKIQKKNLTLEQKDILGRYIWNIIKSNKYLKRKHPFVYKDLQRRLNPNNSNFYCNIAYCKDKLLNSLKSEKRNYTTLEEKIDNTNQSIDNSQTAYKKTFGGYLKNIAKYVGTVALATAMVILPAKYCQKNYYNDKPAVVYTVKKGDNLWNSTKDYLKKNKVKVDNKTVYKAVDEVAENNGRGKQAEYKINSKDKKSPHLIKPGEKIVFSKKVLYHAKQGGKK